jgi:hypothetical protein
VRNPVTLGLADPLFSVGVAVEVVAHLDAAAVVVDHDLLVIIPPEAVWEPIQAIRRRHDRKLRRWMPHITLLYPFRPRSELLERRFKKLAWFKTG